MIHMQKPPYFLVSSFWTMLSTNKYMRKLWIFLNVSWLPWVCVYWMLKQKLVSCNRKVKQCWDLTSFCLCCSVRLYFLNLYPCGQSFGISRNNIHLIMVYWVKAVAIELLLGGFFVLLTIPLGEALHSFQVKQCFFLNVQSSASFSPHKKIIMLKEYCT